MCFSKVIIGMQKQTSISNTTTAFFVVQGFLVLVQGFLDKNLEPQTLS